MHRYYSTSQNKRKELPNRASHSPEGFTCDFFARLNRFRLGVVKVVDDDGDVFPAKEKRDDDVRAYRREVMSMVDCE